MWGAIPTWKKIADVAVDSGTVMITDPCYVLPDSRLDAEGKPYKMPPLDYTWLLEDEKGQSRPEDWYTKPQVVQLPREDGTTYDLGSTLLQNFGGDGLFELFGKFNDRGQLMAVYLDFEGNADQDIPEITTRYAEPDDDEDDEQEEED